MILTSLQHTIKTKVLTAYTKHLVRKSKKKQLRDKAHRTQHIGLLYTYNPAIPEQSEVITQAVNKLQAAQQPVHVLCYLSEKIIPSIPIPFDTFTPQQINLLGKASHQPLNAFVYTPFTHLYHLDTTSNTILDYIIAKSVAKHKIGHYQAARAPLFDIMFKDVSSAEVPTAASFSSMLDKMFHYIHMLKV